MEMMDMAADDTREELRRKLRSNFDGRIVRKDLTKKIKEGANVPVYVLEFLLGQYCSSDDETIIEQGVQNVKRILADNFVRPDEAQKILSQLRKNGSHTIIDMVTVHLDIKKDCFFAEFSNLGLTNVPITDDYPEKYDRLLCGGIWCIVQLEYESEGDSSFGITDIDGQPISSKQKKQKDISPISIHKLTPIQMPHIDIEEVREGRKAFTQEEWMDVMLRSCGYEPEQLNNREKWLLLARMLPLVENNFNLCELGPRSTGKSHIYKEISPNSILVSGGQTTVANLFYNMGRKTVGLVGLWDCVAFDEVAGIKFKDKDGIQIMKDYMASGSFARGKEEKAALNSDVYGQDECKKQILSGMYRLTTGATNKPVVLMLYGPSGVGKTESAKSISKSLGGELLRIQFSMMQTSEAYDYVFGAEHSKSSFARDMMGRESNVILIDEFDKVNPALYNAFYELFDEGKYVDTNYSVELGQAIFLLTCNFSNENEIKKALGPAMFSRIGCCVEYADLTVEQKQKIVNNWYDSIMASLKDDERVYIETTDIHEWFLKNAERYDNIRILKSKMENAIFEKLTDHFIIMTGSMAEGTQDRV